MDRQPLGEVGDGCLGPGIGGDLGQRGIGVHGADVENAAPLAADHLAGKGLGGDQGANEVQVEDKLHPGLVQVKEGLGLAVEIARLKIFLVGGGSGVVAACAVEQNVTRAQILADLVCDGIADVLVQHVAGIGAGNAALFHDLLCIAVCGFKIPVEQSDLRPGPGQHLGKDRAEHTACAGNNGNLAAEIGIEHVLLHKSLL